MKHFLVFLLLFIGIGSVTAQNARITGTVKDNTCLLYTSDAADE